MKNALHVLTAVLFLFNCKVCADETAKYVPGDYFTAVTYELDAVNDGLTGTIELLQDIRLKDRKNPGHMETEDMDIVTDDLPAGDAVEYREALVRIKNKEGKELQVFGAGSAWAALYRVDLYGNSRNTYGVRCDYSRGYGPMVYSYISGLYEFRGGVLQKLKFRRSGEKKTDEENIIELYTNSRSSSRILDSKSGKGKVLLEVRASMNLSEIDYFRFEHDGKEWVLYARSVKGFFDAMEDEFPDINEFYKK